MTRRQDIYRPLHGTTLAVSISESLGLDGRGLDSLDVNKAVFEISRAVLAQGGAVVFGHDWRPGGVMSDMLGFAMLHERAWRGDDASPRLLNVPPWPDKPSLSEEELKKQGGGLLSVYEMPEPSVPDLSFFSEESVEGQEGPQSELIKRVFALTEMRQQLARLASARICIGGRITGSAGRCAGIVEEAFWSLLLRQPLYLSRIFGGAASQVIDVIEGENTSFPSAFHPGRDDVAEALQQMPDIYLEPLRGSKHLWSIETLARSNGLTDEQNRALFEATHLEDVTGLVLQGLKRVRNKPRLRVNIAGSIVQDFSDRAVARGNQQHMKEFDLFSIKRSGDDDGLIEGEG